MMWTDEQARVVTGACANRVIFAAPGSGKTAVLTAHVHQLLATGLMRGREIAVLTFTRQAASELKHRLRADNGLPEEEVEALRVGTFHSQVFRALLESRVRVPVPLHASEQMEMMRTAMEMSGKNPSPVNVRKVMGELTKQKSVWPQSKVPRSLRRTFAAYERLKRQQNRCDLDDLLLAMCDLVEDEARWKRVSWLHSLRYILVDEFQDTNAVQWYILQRLCRLSGASLCVVGDDDQAIYGFRGASPRWLLGFSKAMPEAEEVILSRNFRSCSRIVAYSRRLIEHNRARVGKPIVAVREQAGLCRALPWATEADEAEGVARLVRAETTSSVAILARTRRQLMFVYQALPISIRRGIGFHTLHEAKGREWDVVHIIGAVGDNPYLSWQVWDRNHPADTAQSEEERRLFYVGMTRARLRLFIHVPNQCRGRHCLPIEYVEECGLSLS
ncbi:UvrD-helicase domain-containing protein [Alicyclobacillus kakegawensis]|uniref:UvrD-helicase domain-containing protein n=1 Tax=Alicyclobacillus kakegawensis TaxID=392012 RepID=UPI00082EBA42|nr:ATP-dependent helicase [Alicyclobacillus kakegawensis]